MTRDQPSAGNMTGSILVAHPSLLDPNFRRTILYLSHHSSNDGAVGLVLNRPLDRTVGDLAGASTESFLKPVPVFYGGPVAGDQMLLASIRWIESQSKAWFDGFAAPLGNSALTPESRPGLRAFLGYAGWTRGQLEAEIAQKAWLVMAPSKALIEMNNPAPAWRDLMRRLGPIYKLLAEAPDDPTLN